MPTYVCWTRSGQLSPDQKKRIMGSITQAHHEVATAPRYFVQVIFNELPPGAHFIAGDEADASQIWIRADIRAGRTPEQKSRLMNRMADEIREITGSPRENVWIYISDIPGPSVLEFGHVLPQPGEESAWFEKLPQGLQDKLRVLA